MFSRQAILCKQVQRSFGSTALDAELLKTKVSPAAGNYLRQFGLLPSKLTATGPRGYMTKSDVLSYIKKNNIQRVPQEAWAVPMTEAPKADKPKAASPKKKQ